MAAAVEGEAQQVEDGHSTTVSDETGNPEAKLVLDPVVLWFANRIVVKKVVETSYKTYFKDAYFNWTSTPQDVRDRWWNAFKEKKLNRPPTAAECYYRGHADHDGKFVNIKAEKIWNEFENQKKANLECEVETQKTDDELFFDVGGWNEKGRVFGLDATASSYYGRPAVNERKEKSHGETMFKVWRLKLLNLPIEMKNNENWIQERKDLIKHKRRSKKLKAASRI